MMWDLPEEAYELTSGLGRNFTFIVFIPKTLEEKLQDMKKWVESLEVN